MKKWSAELFWSYVKKTATCWLWTGAVSTDGYGKTTRHGKTMRAHRLAWELTNGEIPRGKIVCHNCDVPLCCRPGHMFVGTPRDNTLDALAKGRLVLTNAPRFSGDDHWTRRMPERLARGERHGSRTHPESTMPGIDRVRPERRARGERIGAAKITEQAVREIRARRARGETQQAIGDAVGVSQVMVGRILRGLNWAHVK